MTGILPLQNKGKISILWIPNFVISYERSVPWNYSANLSNSSQQSIFMLPANPKSYLSSDYSLKCDGSEWDLSHRVLYPWMKKCLKWFWICGQPVLILYFANNQTRPESSGEAVRTTHSSEHPQSQAISFTIIILSSVNYFFVLPTHPSLSTPSHRY